MLKPFFIAAIFSVVLLDGVKCFAQISPRDEEESKVVFTADFYASHVNLMQYKGFQDDVSATLYLQFLPYKLVPFVRFLSTHYYYIPPNSPDHVSDRRLAVGGGLDYRLTGYLRIRAISESINDRASAKTFSQDSYGVIYNQYLKGGWFEFNNYLESFAIPKLAQNRLDTFARVQVFHGFPIAQDIHYSHTVFPFVQAKVKLNDDAIFGLTGQNLTAGGGYKYFRANSKEDNLALLFEVHGMVYQSKEFSADTLQFLAALQWVTE